MTSDDDMLASIRQALKEELEAGLMQLKEELKAELTQQIGDLFYNELDNLREAQLKDISRWRQELLDETDSRILNHLAHLRVSTRSGYTPPLHRYEPTSDGLIEVETDYEPRRRWLG